MKIEPFIQELRRISFLIKKSEEDGEEALEMLSTQIGIPKDEIKKLITEELLDQNSSTS
ncbi:MAG: hypothetical protein WC909_01825 [Candidatus Paceibacterota bacterium]|jgi:hypothetical protein